MTDFLRDAVFKVDPVTNNRTVMRAATNPDQIEAYNVTRINVNPDGSRTLNFFKGYVFSAAFGTNQTRVFIDIFGVGLVDCGTFPTVSDLAVDLSGKVYIATGDSSDPVNFTDGSIRVYDPFGYGLSSQRLASSIDNWGISMLDANTLVSTDLLEGAVYSISLPSGNVSLISRSGARGSGPALSTPADIEVDGNGHITVLATNGSNPDALYSVDVATGNRSFVTSLPDTSTNFTIFPGDKSDYSAKAVSINNGVISGEIHAPLRATFRAYVSPDLVNWLPITDYSQSLSGTIPFSVPEQVLDDSFGVDADQYFFRLEHFDQ